jgi:putative FmdB family regulatory protein
MPFYEYQCQACGAQVEVMQKISDAPLKKCPECGRSRLVKLVSAPVFRLKGGGWYETDFKSDKEAKRNLVGEAEKAEAKSEDKPAEKTDTKPETKPEPKPEPKAEKSAAARPVKARKPAPKKPAPKRRARR